MIILAIDIGTQTGWAVVTDMSLIDSGTFNTKPGKNISSESYRLIQFSATVNKLIETYKPTIIAFEAVKRWMSSSSAFVYNAFLGQLYICADKANVPYIGYSPKEIKVYVTGSGNAKKEAMMAAVETKYNVVPKDDNEADAIGIAFLAQDKLKNALLQS